MTRAARIAVCAVVAVLMAFVGADANAVAAQPHRAARHLHHRHLEHDGNTHVLLALGRLDRQLARSIRHRLSPLTVADRVIVRANAASDQATVEAVASAYSATPSDHHLELARGLLRHYRPQRYIRGTAILRRAGDAAAAIARLRPRVHAFTREDAALIRAADLLATVQPHRITARASAAYMARVRLAVRHARALVHDVRSALAGG